MVKKLTAAELQAHEATRDIGTEILQSIQDMKAGKGKVVPSAASQVRQTAYQPQALLDQRAFVSASSEYTLLPLAICAPCSWTIRADGGQ